MEGYKIKRNLAIIIILVTFVNAFFISGCSIKGCEYKAPQKYYAQMTMTTYSDSEKQNINYDMKILHSNNDYKIKINYDNVDLQINCIDEKCTVINEKYKENGIVTGSKIFDSLISDISLDKFNSVKSRSQGLVEYQEGIYRYVLEYNVRNFAPNKMMVYKDDVLIKTFVYNNLEIYK